MKATYINYRETNQFSPAVLRYLDQDPQLAPFISYQPTLQGFSELLVNKTVIADREALVSVLNEQYAGYQSPMVIENIELLTSKNTFTVTTGHQLNLFTGPLYFIFKIITAINLSRELKVSFPDKNFVPVYWMATEDHDFEEINHTYFGDKKIIWNQGVKGATGRISTFDIDSVIKEYNGVLGISEHAEKLGSIIGTAYSNHTNLADATRYLVNALFENYGLVIIDADHPELKKQFKGVIAQDIIEQNSYQNITSSLKKLEEIHLHAPVNPREINFFYLLDGLRERLTFDGGTYQVLNSEISFSESELKIEIDQYPERFSPNVVMRPLYQEMILPNIAYVGGGAEVVYWLELKENFDHYRIDYPILILRNSAMVGGRKLDLAFRKLSLFPADLFKSAEELKKQWVVKHSEHTVHLADEWQELKCIFEKMKLRVHKIDPTLSASAEAVKARLERAIISLEKKLIKAEKRNHSDSLASIDSLKNNLFPKGGLQERTENFGLYYVQYGDAFIESLVEAFKPLEFKFTILQQ